MAKEGESLTMDVEGGHLHRCREGHTWYHAGPTARPCRVREVKSAGRNREVSPEDCPRCAHRPELLRRGPHSHRCPMCEGAWSHEDGCPEAPTAQCPWCFARREGEPTSGMRAGRHRHLCPQCRQTWMHDEPCAALLRAVLPECPGCRDARVESRESPAEDARAEFPVPTSRARAGLRNHGARRLWVIIAVLGGLVVGVWLVVSFARGLAPPPRGTTQTGAVLPEAASPPPHGAVASRPAPGRSPPPSDPSPAAGVLPPGVRGTEEPSSREDRCVKPSPPVRVVGRESGTVLGLWVDVEAETRGGSQRCLYVIQRSEGVLWVIDASRVRIASREGSP